METLSLAILGIVSLPWAVAAQIRGEICLDSCGCPTEYKEYGPWGASNSHLEIFHRHPQLSLGNRFEECAADVYGIVTVAVPFSTSSSASETTTLSRSSLDNCYIGGPCDCSHLEEESKE